MLLSTQIPLKKQSFNLINYSSTLLLIGSCFSENIDNKLSYFKFQSARNPFGILFHPKAIEKLIVNAIRRKNFTEKDIFYHNKRWHNFDAHSSLSTQNKNELLNNLNSEINLANEQLKNSTHLIITLGTAWVYREITSNKTVANCHKIPQKKFLKSILSVAQISESIKNIIKLTKSINPKITIILTVSPVRHLKDGFIKNQQSKAHLLSAIHQVLASTRSNSFYFPSYEIMMDELRDYRFYTEDMVHPSQTAINYIWEKFLYTWISKETQQTMQEVDTIQKSLIHRPFNLYSEQHQEFLNKLEQKKKTLLQIFPFMKF